MKTFRWTFEHTLYLLAFGLASAVRLLNLGRAPLSDFEANWALQALDIARGGLVSLGPQPAYAILTGFLFTLIDASNGLARFLPALAGSLLVLLPLFFRRHLGFNRAAGIIAALGLALDPGLVALSRLAGGPMMAMGFGLLALGTFYARWWVLAGLLGSLALLSGPSVLQGALGLALAWGIAILLDRSGWVPLKDVADSQSIAIQPIAWRSILWAGAAGLLVAGTLFLRLPQGLGALLQTIPAYLQGWVTPSGLPIQRVAILWLVYQPLGLIFAGVGIIRGWLGKNALVRGLSIWLLLSFALALLYPARQAGDLAWTLIPLWALAAYELSQHLPSRRDDTLTQSASLGQGFLILALLLVARMYIMGSLAGRFSVNIPLYLAGLVIALGFVATLTVALGWSARVAQLGGVWGMVAFLALGVVSATWGASQVYPNGAQELWATTPEVAQVDLFVDTLRDLSLWQSGDPYSLDIVSVADAPSLRWALRDFPQAAFAASFPVEAPSVLISTPEQGEIGLPAAYSGQDFDWWASPAWGGALPADWLRWVVFREAPIQKNKLILWARGDLFPGGISMPELSGSPE